MKFGPQPAHQALCFFGGAAGIQRHQAAQQGLGPGLVGRLVGPRHGAQIGPAVGLQHSGVQIVVQRAQHADQALFVQQFVFSAQRFTAAQLGQHVVQAGEGDRFKRDLAGFAVAVQLLSKLADVVAQFGGQAGIFGGEGEGFEAPGVVVDRVVSDA